MWGCCTPEDVGVPHVAGPQRNARQELVAEPVLEGAVEVGGAAMGTQHLEVPQLRLPVHEQLRLPAVDADQHRVRHGLVCVARNELVGDAIGEELEGEKGGRADVCSSLPRQPGMGDTRFPSSDPGKKQRGKRKYEATMPAAGGTSLQGLEAHAPIGRLQGATGTRLQPHQAGGLGGNPAIFHPGAQE